MLYIVTSMTNYQLTFLISQKLEAEQVTPYQDKINEKLKEFGAEIKNVSETREQMLAYAIRGERKVWLGNLFFSTDPEKIAEINRFLDQEPHILRKMISILPDEKKVSERRTPPKREEKAIEETAGKEPTSEEIDQKINEILDW